MASSSDGPAEPTSSACEKVVMQDDGEPEFAHVRKKVKRSTLLRHLSEDLPGPLNGAKLLSSATAEELPDAEALAARLAIYGLDTSSWGDPKAKTKTVKSFLGELHGKEAGLDFWQLGDGRVQPVRNTHVLRAKVTSSEAIQRGLYLFNTWQQFGDGRKRIRNGLLSEKLTLDEMPFEEHIAEICRRAVTEEEMQRVAESAFKIIPGEPLLEYDPDYVCPLEVVDSNFVDYTMEVEESKSYPGLLTVYHLYTVDIICKGLPNVDFNTIEFDHPDNHGKRTLKYVHAWVWLEWSQIRRYLFEGSVLKERKTKGSFKDVNHLRNWLEAFGLDLDKWGTDGFESVEDLFQEVEQDKSNLELWGRHDGAPLLMRVVHVIQLRVLSDDLRLSGKFLLQVWQQTADGNVTSSNRLPAKKLNATAGGKNGSSFDDKSFEEAARKAVRKSFGYLVDIHIHMDPKDPPQKANLEHSGIEVLSATFVDHRFDVEESPTFKGMLTMYHLYTVEVVCQNLHTADFASIDVDRSRPVAYGWRWVTWQQTMDIFNARAQAASRRDSRRLQSVEQSLAAVSDLCRLLGSPMGGPMPPEYIRARQMLDRLSRDMEQLRKSYGKAEQDLEDLASMLPPSMISKMSSQTIASEEFIGMAENRELQRISRTSTLDRRQMRREHRDSLSSIGLGACSSGRDVSPTEIGARSMASSSEVAAPASAESSTKCALM